MTTANIGNQPELAKWGWWILLAVSALMILNGVTWFFIGPARAPFYLAQVAGVPVEEFTQRFPDVIDGLARNRRQVAIWYAAFGSLALIVALEGLRHGASWVWKATWVVVAAPIAIGLVYTPGGELSFDNVGLFSFAAIALVGQLLARPRRRSP